MIDPRDLVTSLTIDNLMQSEVGKVLEALRDAGYEVEINLTRRSECVGTEVRRD